MNPREEIMKRLELVNETLAQIESMRFPIRNYLALLPPDNSVGYLAPEVSDALAHSICQYLALPWQQDARLLKEQLSDRTFVLALDEARAQLEALNTIPQEARGLFEASLRPLREHVAMLERTVSQAAHL